MEKERPLRQITKDIHIDQIEEIERLARVTNFTVAKILRLALDKGLGLPKKKKRKKKTS